MQNAKSSNTNQLVIAGLIQGVIYCGIWLWNEYVASYITIIFPVMIALILILSAIADWIEPSRIPKWYYALMIISIVIPILVGALFYMMYGGKIEWMN